jgi:hypothetical protein
MSGKKGLSIKHELFCKEYLIDFNGGRAYATAYDKKNVTNACYVNAFQLLRNTKIQERLAIAIEKASVVTGVTVESVLTRINNLANNAEKDCDKLKALEMLSKYLKLFNDVKIEDNSVKIVIETKIIK